jgi:hypothetical protein
VCKFCDHDKYPAGKPIDISDKNAQQTPNGWKCGSFFYRTSSTGKLAFLNNLVGLFEYEWDEGGNSTAKVGVEIK